MTNYTYPHFIETGHRSRPDLVDIFLKKADEGDIVIVDGEKYNVSKTKSSLMSPTKLILKSEDEKLIMQQDGSRIMKIEDNTTEVSEVQIIKKYPCHDCGEKTKLVTGEISGVKCTECGNINATYDI